MILVLMEVGFIWLLVLDDEDEEALESVEFKLPALSGTCRPDTTAAMAAMGDGEDEEDAVVDELLWLWLWLLVRLI